MRFCVLTSAFCLLVSLVHARQPGFDPRDVARRVRNAGRETSGAERLALDDGEFLIDTSSTLVPAPYNQKDPAVAFDGANFLVVWEDYGSDYYGIYGARVTPQGTLLDPSGLAISQAAYNDQYSPALGFDGTNFLVVWQDNRGGPSDIYGARVTPAGTVLDPSGLAISQAAYSQYSPALGFDGTNFLVVWEDRRSGYDT
ncbi:MAG: hypothetical protein NTX53_19325, partial [candidate division WOR-3 bacterium]|nr:hypothetical protein [candidate division WOR-3 bacterium]